MQWFAFLFTNRTQSIIVVKQKLTDPSSERKSGSKGKGE